MKTDSIYLLIEEGLKEIRAQIEQDLSTQKSPKGLILFENSGNGGFHLVRNIFSKSLREGKKLEEFKLSLLPQSNYPKILSGKNEKGDLTFQSGDLIFVKEAERLWSRDLSEKDRRSLQRSLSTFLKKGKKGKRLILSLSEKEKDLERAISQKRMTKILKDLILKLSYCLPSLREIKSRLPEIIGLVLQRKFPKIKIDDLAMARIQGYPWPNNFMELDQCLILAAERCENNIITLDDLPLPIPAASGDDLYPQKLPRKLRS